MMDDMSRSRAANYFCCTACGYLWTTRKGSAEPRHNVTRLAKAGKRTARGRAISRARAR
jgi:hypothetical protein